MLQRTAHQPVIRLTKRPAKGPVIRFLASITAACFMAAFGAPTVAAEQAPAKPQAAIEGSSSATQPPPSELAREGLAKMLQALDALVQSVPQYHMPEITENGDIILRRKQPQPAPVPPPQRPTPPAEKAPGTPI